jgi:aminoacyl tRNA synthase complex-interacting multifunctional protein 1
MVFIYRFIGIRRIRRRPPFDDVLLPKRVAYHNNIMSSNKSALNLLDTLITELEANVAAAGINIQPPPAPAASSSSSKTGAKADSGAGKVENSIQATGEKVEKSKPDKKKGGGRPPKVEPNPPPKDVETVHAMDFRVGVIVSVKKHDTADKLYCEEIDIGEAEPRQIASGLVPHYSLEEMQGRRLIVVANLKPRNLVGFKSSGMVLCAAKADPSHPTGEKVEFVEPPADAKPGDRLLGENLEIYDALTQGQTEKQKMWEKIAAKLSTNENKEACWNGVRLVVAGQPCTVPTCADAAIR